MWYGRLFLQWQMHQKIGLTSDSFFFFCGFVAYFLVLRLFSFGAVWAPTKRSGRFLCLFWNPLYVSDNYSANWSQSHFSNLKRLWRASLIEWHHLAVYHEWCVCCSFLCLLQIRIAMHNKGSLPTAITCSWWPSKASPIFHKFWHWCRYIQCR